MLWSLSPQRQPQPSDMPHMPNAYGAPDHTHTYIRLGEGVYMDLEGERGQLTPTQSLPFGSLRFTITMACRMTLPGTVLYNSDASR